ncbi:F62 protein [Hirschfeldia incana]|nr:F62 protein [Hirschfeldia incana]
MRGELYFRHEIDRNPSASDAGTIKACATMVTWHEDMEDPERTFSFTWLAEDVIEGQGLASKLQELNELFMDAAFTQEETLLLLTQEVNHCVIELTSSGNYTRDCALSLWFTLRVWLPPLPLPPSVDEFEVDVEEATNSNIPFRAASKLAVKSLTKKIYNKGGSLLSDSCTICLEGFKNGVEVVELPCGHEFDDACIAHWFATDHVCPLCRFELPREHH